jgi:hypothetical protein
MAILKWGLALLVLANIVLFLWPADRTPEGARAVIASPVNPESMRLLREPSINTEQEEPMPQERSQPAVAANCGKIGPIVNPEQLEFAREQLASLSLNFSENVEPGRSADVLRLYLASTSGTAGIDSLRARLNDAGITDHFRMASEEGVQMLSLGVYSEPDRAELVATEYHGLGFEVQIRDETTRLPDRYWLLVGLEGKSSQLVRTLSGMIWGAPGVGFSSDLCKI